MSHALTAHFGMLYEDNQPKVYRLALGLSGNPHDAEEITQEAFLRAFRSYRDFRGECSFFTWIYRIAVNVTRDYLKKRNKLPIQVLTEDLGYSLDQIIDPDPHSDPETELLSREIRFRCLHCFTECLPAAQRIIFCLAVTLGLPYKTVADIAGCSQATVKTSVHRARKRVAGFLENRCGLVKKSNPCRCGQWVRFALSQGWISKDRPASPPVEVLLKAGEQVVGLKTLKDLYQNLCPGNSSEALAERIKQGIRNKEWEIFS